MVDAWLYSSLSFSLNIEHLLPTHSDRKCCGCVSSPNASMVPLLVWRRQRALACAPARAALMTRTGACFFGHVAPQQEVCRLQKCRLKCQREHAASESEWLRRQPEACGQTSSSAAEATPPPPKVAVFCKRRFFKEEPRRRRWGVAREFEESEVDVFSGKSSETAGSQESRFRTSPRGAGFTGTVSEIDALKKTAPHPQWSVVCLPTACLSPS